MRKTPLNIRVVPIDEKMREIRLKWFGQFKFE